MREDLHDTRFLLRNLMENMPDMIYFKDADSRFILVNKAYCERFDIEHGEIVGKTDFDLFADAHAQQAYDDEQRIISTGAPLVNFEEKETWPDGRIRQDPVHPRSAGPLVHQVHQHGQARQQPRHRLRVEVGNLVVRGQMRTVAAEPLGMDKRP